MSFGEHPATVNANTTFPVKTKTIVTPSKASLVIHVYSNRLFIIVSEVEAGSAGTLIEFKKEFAPELPSSFQRSGDNDEIEFESSTQDVVYDIKVLFGVEKSEILLAARVLGSKIHQSGCACSELPILFGVGLKRFDKPLLEEVANALIESLNSI